MFGLKLPNLAKRAPPVAATMTYPNKINVGCGFDKRAGYLNVDMSPCCEPDLLLKDNDYATLPAGHFDEVLANDVLEHIPRAETLGVLLEWANLLKMGGEVVLSTSNVLGVAKQMSGKSYADQHGWTICLFGNQVQDGDFHLTGFTPKTLTVQLLSAGLEPNIMDEEVDGWLLKAKAAKTFDWTTTLAQEGVANLDDEAFVNVCYQAAFERVADPLGMNHFKVFLSAGGRRRDVLKRVFSSEERLFLTAAKAGL